MSRISKFFQQQCNRNSEEKQSSSTEPPAEPSGEPNNGLIDTAAAADEPPKVTIERKNFLDSLNPEVKKVLEEVRDSERKLHERAQNFNLDNALHSIPVLPRIAHQLPEQIKSRLKTVIDKINPSEVCAKTPQNKEPATQALTTTSDVSVEAQANSDSSKPSAVDTSNISFCVKPDVVAPPAQLAN